MLDLRRLRLLRELQQRGTIAAVADALQFTPSAVSQQLAMLERETGVRLLERAGRGRAADRPGARARRARRRAARPRRGRRGRPRRGGRDGHRPRAHRRLPVGAPRISRCRRWRRWRDDAPRLRCEVVEAEPEQALPALALGDVDLVLGDEWQHQPWRLPAGLARHDLFRDPVSLLLPAAHPVARAHPEAVPLAALAGAAVGDRPRRDGVGGRRRSARAASSAASSPTCATGRTTRRSASRSWPAASRSRCCPRWRCPTRCPDIAVRRFAERPGATARSPP